MEPGTELAQGLNAGLMRGLTANAESNCELGEGVRPSGRARSEARMTPLSA